MHLYFMKKKMIKIILDSIIFQKIKFMKIGLILYHN